MKPIFDQEVKDVIICSRDAALGLRNNFITIEHLFLGMLKVQDAKFLKRANFDLKLVEDEIIQIIKKANPHQENEIQQYVSLPLTPYAENVLAASVIECKLSRRLIITTQDLFLAMLNHDNEVKKLLSKRDISYSTVYASYLARENKLPRVIVYKNELSKIRLCLLKLKLFYLLRIK